MPDIAMTEFEESQRNPVSVEVEINASSVSGTQQNIPLKVGVPDSYNSSLNVVAFGDRGEQLPTEIEAVVNNKSWVWLANTVQSIENQNMKIFYGGKTGKPAANSTYGSQNVWDANTVMVQHMVDNPDTSHIKDSTSYANDGTKYAAGQPLQVDLPYGKAQSFDSTNAYIDVPDVPAWDFSSSDGTISFWMKQTVINNYEGLVGQSHSISDFHWSIFTGVNTRSIAVGVNGKTPLTSPVDTITDGERNFVVVTKSSGTTKIYTNAVERINGTGTYFDDSPLTLRFGWMNDGSFDGNIQNVRISNTSRSTTWISTTYNNEKNPTATGTGAFYSSISRELNYTQTLKQFGRSG